MTTDSEAELQGLLAHEIAHVAARHATRAETAHSFWLAPSRAAMRSSIVVAGGMLLKRQESIFDGPIVDEKALLEALRERRNMAVKDVGLDAYRQYRCRQSTRSGG